MLSFNSCWFSELVHRNIHRTEQMLSLPKFFYQSKRLSSPMSHQVDAKNSWVSVSSSVKVYQLNKASLAGVGQNGKEASEVCLVTHRTRYQHAPSTGPHLHRGSSPPHQPPSYANNLLCLCAVCCVPVVSVRHTGILLFTSAWAGQPLWSSQKTMTLNLHKEKKKARLHWSTSISSE